jgi:hypothetical protein
MMPIFAHALQIAEDFAALKEDGFSRAEKRPKRNAVNQASEKGLNLVLTVEKHFSKLKGSFDFAAQPGQLKSCLFKTMSFSTSRSTAVEKSSGTNSEFFRFSLALGTWAALALAAFSCVAQTASPPTKQEPQGKVIFSRSMDENGQTITTHADPVASQLPVQTAEPSAKDEERQAVTFTAFDLDVRLYPATRQIAVRALVTLRNDGKTPLNRIPLQISSSLNWERIRVNSKEEPSKDIVFQVATLNSDADHTGQLHEATVPLDKTAGGPLAPGQSIQLDVTYSGKIAPSAQRLLAIGAPENVALHSDWDQIGVSFTGLRGFGNVVWYPVASEPVFLGNGARLFEEMGKHKLRLRGAHFRLRLTVEFPHGQAPTVALINGRSVPLATTESGRLDQEQEVAGVATASLENATLGFEAPSLFVAIRTPHPGPNLAAWTLPDNNVSVGVWTTAATTVTPFLEGWLGKQPLSQLTLLDLPDPQDAPFETGALLATSLSDSGTSLDTKLKITPDQLNGILVQALTHAWILSPTVIQPPAWLNEGLAGFMGTLWIERQYGRDRALGTLEAERAALALAEPESPGQSSGEPLAQAISPVYYRTKAAYVLWMLRDLAGDHILSVALKAYSAQDADKNSGKKRGTLEKLLEEAGNTSDLSWFFADWVDADKGLPDLSIGGVFPTTAAAGNWLVAVNLVNDGYAQADVAVTVRSGYGSDATFVTRRVLIPARGKITERILIRGKPVEVQANDGTVPEIQASVHVMHLDEPKAGSSSSSQANLPE